MLSARYIHLADALGLGALWLKRGAKVNTPATRPTLTHTPNAKRIHLPKIEAKQKPVPNPIATPTIDTAALLSVRSIWTKTVTASGVSILWLTLRSQLNISVAELTEKSNFGKLLRQFIYATTRSNNMIWQNFPDNSVVSGSLKLPDTADKIIILSEELAQHIQTDTPQLTLPHPEQLLRKPISKKEMWQKVQVFLR